MANYITEGNKTVYCRSGHPNMVPFQITTFKCQTCGHMYFVNFFGTVIDKNGNYIY